jgi:hypothetical protein
MLLNFILPTDALVIGRGKPEDMSAEPSVEEMYKGDTGDVEAVDVSDSMKGPEEIAENNVGKEELVSFRA